MLKDQIIEFSSTEKSNQLTKQTRTTYYILVLLLLGYRNFFAKTTVPQQEDKFNQISLKRFLDKSDDEQEGTWYFSVIDVVGALTWNKKPAGV
ncbi:MAG: hypothetical protein R6X27_19460 [Candidatus Desulfacyla sp.]